ncbi:MAG: hypothetical protein ACKVQS_02840 [Fimbriimonadaceae bacterium]
MKKIGWTLLAVVFLVSCNKPEIPEINTDIAEAYLEFYEKGVSDKPGAEKALERARTGDSNNGYTDYLSAWMKIQSQDYNGSLSDMKAGNVKPKVIIYVTAPPPADSMQSLGRVRQVGFSTAKFEEFSVIAPDYFSECRKMGARVAQAEPVCSLSVLNGAGVIRKSFQSEIDFWKSKKDLKRAKVVEDQLLEFATWYDSFQKALSEKVTDLVGDAAKAAGMTESEKMDYAQGKPIADQRKAEIADKKRLELYAEEVAALRRMLKTMPGK